jgi:hypothetical protein
MGMRDTERDAICETRCSRQPAPRAAESFTTTDAPRRFHGPPQIVLGLALAADPAHHPRRIGDERRHRRDPEAPGEDVVIVVDDRERNRFGLAQALR